MGIDKKYFAIGMMSGTSLDGLDIVYSSFSLVSGKWSFKILESDFIPYEIDFKRKLSEAIKLNSDELKVLDIEFGRYLGEKCQNFILNYEISKLDFIASHGHTILHEPDKGITLQVGDGNEISRITSTKVVYDFRTQDVELGGQGAPLVPIGDRLLFSEYDYRINIGGFANISFEKDNTTIAYDICPVNSILNPLSEELGFPYDDGGKIAASGMVNYEMLRELNSLNYYRQTYPKSLGVEWNRDFIQPIISKYNSESIQNIISTFTEHAAIQIANSINESESSVIITGGGAYNSNLIERIKSKTNVKIIQAEDVLINYKEALVFAFLGVLRIENKNNVLSSVTGASKDHSSGKISYI